MGYDFRITLRIAGREYPLTIDRREEEKYRRAAREVNELVTLYSRRYSADLENYLAMVALQMALTNIDSELKHDLSPVIGELEKVVEELRKIPGGEAPQKKERTDSPEEDAGAGGER